MLVAGALSSDPTRARASARDLNIADDRAYGSWQELLDGERARPEDDRIDLVVIVTPNDVHYPVAKAAVEAGYHVVCDKPLVHTSEQAAELGNEGEVDGDPGDVVELGGGQPAVLVVVDEPRLPRDQSREVDPQHRRLADEQVGSEARADDRLAAQLLVQLAYERLLVGLAGVDLATGELPQTGQVRRRGPPGGEHPGRVVTQQGGTDHRDTHTRHPALTGKDQGTQGNTARWRKPCPRFSTTPW